MFQQKKIQEKHREKLIDWLFYVCSKFRLLDETVFLTINLFDRYLSLQEEVPIEMLQIVGISCLFIAGKYQEIYPPELRDYVHISGYNFQKEPILKMECEILKKLKFDILSVNPLVLHERLWFVQAASSKDLTSLKYTKNYQLGVFLLKLSLLNYKMLKYSPNVLASSANFLARKICDMPTNITYSMISKNGYNLDFTECMLEMIQYGSKILCLGDLHIKKIYSSELHLNVFTLFETNIATIIELSVMKKKNRMNEAKINLDTSDFNGTESDNHHLRSTMISSSYRNTSFNQNNSGKVQFNKSFQAQSSNYSTLATESSNRSFKNQIITNCLETAIREDCKSESKNKNIRKASVSSNASFNFNAKINRQAKSKENFDMRNIKTNINKDMKEGKEAKSKAYRAKTQNY